MLKHGVAIAYKLSPFFFFRNILTSVAKNLDFNSDIKVLDVGCGSGSWIMVKKINNRIIFFLCVIIYMVPLFVCDRI